MGTVCRGGEEKEAGAGREKEAEGETGARQAEVARGAETNTG